MRWVVRPVELTPQPPGTGAHLPAKGKALRPTLYGVDRFGGRGRDGCSREEAVLRMAFLPVTKSEISWPGDLPFTVLW
jgi:hypothetical protein